MKKKAAPKHDVAEDELDPSYPKMLYGDTPEKTRIVNDAEDEGVAIKQGYSEAPQHPPSSKNHVFGR